MRHNRISLLFTAALFLLLLVALGNALLSGHHSNLFPLAVTLPTILLCLLILFWECRGIRLHVSADQKGGRERDSREAKVYLWFVGFMAATLILGFGFAAPLFIVGYLLVIGKKTLGFSAVYTVLISVIVYFVLKRTLGMSWPPGLLVF